MRNLILYTSLLFYSFLSAQNGQLDDWCGTEPSHQTYEEFASFMKTWSPKANQLRSQRDNILINITPHVFRRSDGSGDNLPTENDIKDDIDYTNQWYNQFGFRVTFIEQPIRYINNTTWYNITNSNSLPRNALETNYNVPGHLNLYYTNAESYGPSTVTPYIFHNMRDAGWGWTVAHEAGHWLNLSHTFGGSENVTRTLGNACFNCDSAGDYLCDTPADYGTDWCDDDDTDYCGCTGDYDEPNCNNPGAYLAEPRYDNCNNAYSPDVYNLMSYGCRPCAHNLTPMQVDVMYASLAEKLELGYVDYAACTDQELYLGGTLTQGGGFITNSFLETKQLITINHLVVYDADMYVDLSEGFRAETYTVNGNPNPIPVNVLIQNNGCN